LEAGKAESDGLSFRAATARGVDEDAARRSIAARTRCALLKASDASAPSIACAADAARNLHSFQPRSGFDTNAPARGIPGQLK
jgi:hypothetical protein